MVSTLSYVVFCSILALYYYLIIRSHKDVFVSSVRVLGIGGLAGACKGAYISLSAYELGLIPTLRTDLATRVISAALIGSVGIFIMAYLYSEIHRVRRLRHARLQELTNAQAQRLASDALFNQLSQQTRSSMVHDLSNDIENALLAFESQTPSGQQLDLALSKLTQASRKQLDKISTQINQQLETKYPPLSFRELFRFTMHDKPYPTVAMAFIMLISTPGFILTSDLDSHVIHRVAIATTSTFIGGGIGNLIFRHLKRGHIYAWVFILVATSVAPFIVNALWHGDHIMSRLLPIGVYVFWLTIVATSTSLLRAFIIQRRRIETVLVESIDENRVQDQAAKQVNRALLNDLATYVHGRVQSRLMASAMTISTAQRADDEATIEQELSEIRRLASNPLENFSQVPTRDLTTALADLAQTWNGLLAIQFADQDLAIIPTQLATRVNNVIEEAILNSFRHGHASEVQINVSSLADTIQIRVSDDGVGPRGGKPSLGSALFDSICSQWNLASGPEGIGTVLTLNLSLTA